MTAKTRYWDHERCAWVDYDRDIASPESLGEDLPEQRADAETAPRRRPALEQSPPAEIANSGEKVGLTR